MKSLIAALLLLPALAFGQTAPTLTFVTNVTTGAGSVTPTLTWSTSPAATSCTASGDWSGTKAASGTQVLTATKTATYTLNCVWGGAGNSASLKWVNATQNTDGSSYTNPKALIVLYGKSRDALDKSVQTSTATHTSYSVENLAEGTWYFAVRSLNQNDVTSDLSAIVSKTVGGTSVQRTITVTVNPKPNPPTELN